MHIRQRFARHSFRFSVLAFAIGSALNAARAQEADPEEVVVNATALRENPLEVAQPTAIVSGDELRRQIASSIGETLSQELGVSSTYFGPSASRPVIRGLGGDRVQVLEDGLSALDVSGLSQDHAVSLEAVVSEQIEIIKGPAALLYGSGASGGLVNIVSNRIPSRTANAPLNGAAEVRGASATDELTGALSLNGGSGAFAWHADYFDRQTDDIRIPGFAQSAALRQQLLDEGETPSDAQDTVANSASDTSGGAFGVSLIGDSGFGGVSYSRFETTYGIPVEEEAFIDMKQDRYDLSGEWRPGNSTIDAVRVRGAYNDYTHTEFEAPGEPGTAFFQAAYDLRVSLDHHFGDWRGTFGAQLLDVDFEALGEEAFVPPSQTRALSLFGFEERHFDNWTVELGARAENQKIDVTAGLPGYDESAINLSAGLVWKFVADHALAFNVTRTERHPQAAELYAEGPHIASGRVELGDSSLDVESALTFDVSLRRSGGGVTWTLNAFYNDYDDYIFLAPTGLDEEIEPGEFLPVFQVLQQPAKLYGYEAEILVPLNLLSTADIQLRLASDYVRGELDDGSNLPQMPAQRYGVGLHFELGDWHAGLEAFYNEKQEKVAEYELPTGSFTTVDLDASRHIDVGATRLFVFLRGSNLLDEEARQATSPLKDFVPLPGRSLSAGVRVAF